MVLSAEDLFTLFNRACATVTGSAPYQGSLAAQTKNTQGAWLQFHRELSHYVDNVGAATPARPNASKIEVTRATEDAIKAAIEQFDWDGQGKMYRVLYNIGHRINR